MTCTHIRQVIRKINELIEKIGDDDTALYKSLGTYVKEEELTISTMTEEGGGRQPTCGGSKNYCGRAHYVGSSWSFKHKYNNH